MRNLLHLANSPPEPPGGEPVWPAHLEVVRGKLFGSIGSKDLGPWSAPDSLGKRIIIRAQFLFNTSRQGGSQPAVPRIR